ncbi:LysR family transcriptional regulator [Pseudomonas abietaniphila]|uniref:LysR family transcriptional regulator n=1 Tax=Pseudomonas abietaniphila TaxID=89065 RepID=UPI003D361D89
MTLSEILHFGRAAEKLRIAQPALTQHIQRLERELGVQLFDRGPRNVSLTPVGKEFLTEARRVLAQVERAVLVAVRAQRGEVGRLEISYMGSMAYSGILPELLAAYEDIAPNVSVGLLEADQEFQISYLEEGRTDIALVRLPLGKLPEGISTIVVKKERVVACLRKGHRLSGKSINLPELKDEPFLTTHLKEGQGFYDTALHICRTAGFEPQVASRSHQFATIVGLVGAGRGIALVPESVIKLAVPGVVYEELVGELPTSDVAIAFRSEGNSPATNRFIELCFKLYHQAASHW